MRGRPVSRRGGEAVPPPVPGRAPLSILLTEPQGAFPALVVPRRPPPPARRRDARTAAGATAFTVHALLLAILIAAKVAQTFSLSPPRDPGFDIVFGAPAQNDAQAAPPPSAHWEQAEPLFDVPRESLDVPPPLAAAPQAMPVPPRRQRAARAANPFAGMPIYGMAPGRATRPNIAVARGMDLDATHAGAAEANPNIVAPGADGSFLQALSDYVESHKTYPDLAVRNGESGTSLIRAVFHADGSVASVQLLHSAGSRTLDVAWMSLFKGKRLPFAAGSVREGQEVTMSMDYILVPQ